MPKPGEHKTVQARLLKYAEEIGWTVVPRAEAQQRKALRLKVLPRLTIFSAQTSAGQNFEPLPA